MSQIVVQLVVTPTPLPAANIPFAAIALVVTDNSGAVLPPVTLTGIETPPWSATLTGVDGNAEATAVATALDTAGNTLATLSGSESGMGGELGTFPNPTGMTVTVTG
jgi:hypothetical protein